MDKETAERLLAAFRRQYYFRDSELEASAEMREEAIAEAIEGILEYFVLNGELEPPSD